VTLGAMPMAPAAFRVLGVHRDTASIRTLRVAPADGSSLARCEPGQFNMLYSFGVGEVPISLSGIGRDGSQYHTIRDVGAVTSALCRLRRGDVVGVRGPFGVGWPVAEARGHDVLLVAGGLGMAPLRSALRAVVQNRAAYGKVALVYATRAADSVLFLGELERVAARSRVDRGNAGWPYDVGPVTPLLRNADVDPSATVAMTCGPEAMMRFVATELRARGVAEDHVYVSLERNMKCAVNLCGHCQLGPLFICGDGPVFRYDRVADLMARREA
jgi:NAD(P)H-flavin reductase